MPNSAASEAVWPVRGWRPGAGSQRRTPIAHRSGVRRSARRPRRHARNTIAMRTTHRRLPAGQRYPLPPRSIIEGSLPEPVKHKIGERGRQTATLPVTSGTALPLAPLTLCFFRISRSSAALYGVLVWAESYCSRCLQPACWRGADRHPLERNLLIIRSLSRPLVAVGQDRGTGVGQIGGAARWAYRGVSHLAQPAGRSRQRPLGAPSAASECSPRI
jgi:hypothetical protein